MDRRRKKGGIKDKKKKAAKSTTVAASSKKAVNETQTPNFFQVLQPAKSLDTTSRYKLRSKATLNAALADPVNYKSPNSVDGPESGLFLYLDLHGHTTKRG